MKSKYKGFLQSLGPGLLMAGAAIGVSHLIQSTRAGADYGFGLVWAVILANLFKYPFFEFGPRYTAATGKSLLDGYLKIGKWAITVFLVFTLLTMFTTEAALVLTTAGLAGELFGIELTPVWWSIIVVSICMAILIPGRYPLLDKIMKVIISILALSTIVAVVSLLTYENPGVNDNLEPAIWTVTGISFIVALMGWMPSIVDISVWHSLWAIERRKQTNHQATMNEALFDFNLGYISTSILALVFLSLGALLMFGNGESFSNNGIEFAGQLVSLYTRSLGSWAGPVIIIAAFSTIFTTTLTVTDAYPRVLQKSTELILPGLSKIFKTESLYFVFMIILAFVAIMIISFLQSGIKSMVDLATTLAFLTTPVLSFINYKVITDKHVPENSRPKTWLKILSWCGLIFWTGFALIFIWIRFIA